MKIVITGGAGFIGSRFVKLCEDKDHDVVVIDKMTYAANENNLKYPFSIIKKVIEAWHNNYCIKIKFSDYFI